MDQFRQCGDFHVTVHQLVTDSQEIESIVTSEGIDEEDVSGLMLKVGDGEYDEIWFTTSSRPWMLIAEYQRFK